MECLPHKTATGINWAGDAGENVLSPKSANSPHTYFTSVSSLGSVMLFHPHAFLLPLLFSPNSAQVRPLSLIAAF